MRIGRIRGYQPYDVFVEHRLDRAFRHAQAINARFQQVSLHEERLRKQLNSQRSERHQRVIARLQVIAEYPFWLVLAPYYFGSLLKIAVPALFFVLPPLGLFTENTKDDWEAAGKNIGTVGALIAFLWGIKVVGVEWEKKQLPRMVLYLRSRGASLWFGLTGRKSSSLKERH
jgi:hypothetical protein